MMKYFTLFTLALLLAACAGNNDATTTDPNAVDSSEMADQDGTATVQSTVDAVQANGGDITALPADAALANIDSWIDQLDDNEDASKVTGNLEELQEALGEQPINGPLVGMLLITLAEDTRQVAGTAPGVSTLVSALQSGGEKLTDGAFGSSSLLDQTLAAVRAKAADITTLGVPTATKNIDSWITELRGMDGTDDMIGNLETLKTELGASEIDGERVSELLFGLAEETRELAGDNQGLAVLAYALEAGGWRLEGADEEED